MPNHRFQATSRPPWLRRYVRAAPELGRFFDEGHSSDEERFLMLGLSTGARLLIACHCEREHGQVIRIISARKATNHESTFYKVARHED